jgi:hypothetical protein
MACECECERCGEATEREVVQHQPQRQPSGFWKYATGFLLGWLFFG